MGITTIIVSHDPAIAKQVDRVVAIRDGMLASETVRQARDERRQRQHGRQRQRTRDKMARGIGGLHDTFEELVVLDRAGRVHVPQEYLEQYQIKGRARLELIEGGILIRAVAPQPPAGAAAAKEEGGQEAQRKQRKTAAEGDAPQDGKRGLFGRFGRRNKKQ